MRCYLPESTMANLYNAFITPYIDYGIHVWGGAPKTHLNKIGSNLRKAVRTMTFKGKGEPTEPLSRYLDILPLDLKSKFHQGTFMKKLLLKEQPQTTEYLFLIQRNE